MLNTDNRPPESAQDQLKQLIAYKQQLNALLEDTQTTAQQLSSEMKRQQTLVTAAFSIEGTNRDKLKKEQELLNKLEEENKAALLELAYAKQKSIQAMRRYNEQLENIKHIHSHLDQDTEAAQNQQQNIRQLIADWQNSNFFLQKQQKLEDVLDERIGLVRAHLSQNQGKPAPALSFDAELPPLAELTAPKPKPNHSTIPAANQTANQTAAQAPGSVNANVNENIAPRLDKEAKEAEAPAVAPPAAEHANANFWESEKRAAIKPNIPKKPAEAAEAPPEEGEEPVPAKPRKSLGQLIISYSACIALAIAVAFLIRTWVLVPTQVSGSSMQPTLDSDDKVLTSPLPYLWSAPQRGDVVVFQAPNEPEGVYYVKRVIALPGEHLQIMDGQVYVNEERLAEPYIEDTYTSGYIDTLVPNDSFFVMGDNREVSHDSRDSDVSFIESSAICGQALWRIYPFDAIGSIK